MSVAPTRTAYPATERGQHQVSKKAHVEVEGEGIEVEGEETTPPGIKDKDPLVKGAGEPYGDTPQLATTKAANHQIYVPILKTIDERHTIMGVVLEPDTVDAHGDIIPALVILDAAEDFLADYNRATTMGLMHKDLNPPIDLVQSWIVPDMDIVINGVTVKAGSWVITARVNDKSIWGKIKQGKLTGFSIGGLAQVENLQPEAA